TGGSIAPDEIAYWRDLTHDALRIEIDTPRTYQESVDVFRIGAAEVNANPDGIDFTGPLFETLKLFGMFTRESASDRDSAAYRAGEDAVFANTDTAMGHVWMTTPGNTRADQIDAGAKWLRINLAATAEGVGFQPLSQALQEYPEMAGHYRTVHERLAPDGGTVQLLARIGYGPEVAPSPRWSVEDKLIG
ncbi:MAG: Acg family FMN-binding oxidoreductase, partial [Shimia sp.]